MKETNGSASESNVVALNGQKIFAGGESNPDVVKLLEEALERARSGDIQGFALAWTCVDDSTNWKLCGLISRGLIGTLEIAKFHIVAALEID